MSGDPLQVGVALLPANLAFAAMSLGSLGLSVLASIAATRTNDLLLSGAGLPFALSGGYQVAFYVGAAFAALAALISGVFLHDERQADLGRESGGPEAPGRIRDDAFS